MKTMLQAFIEGVLTLTAALWVSRYIITEIVSATLVVVGVSLVYTPAAFVVAGALLWKIAQRIEAHSNVSEPR